MTKWTQWGVNTAPTLIFMVTDEKLRHKNAQWLVGCHRIVNWEGKGSRDTRFSFLSANLSGIFPFPIQCGLARRWVPFSPILPPWRVSLELFKGDFTAWQIMRLLSSVFMMTLWTQSSLDFKILKVHVNMRKCRSLKVHLLYSHFYIWLINEFL